MGACQADGKLKEVITHECCCPAMSWGSICLQGFSPNFTSNSPELWE